MTFDTVLVANRGEIAMRLIRACHKLGLRAVVVYSDADRDAPFVEVADMAVHIGPSEAAKSYLDGTKIIEAALRSGAGAIHPGYGFLAENAGFAADCAKAGLVFVGPSAENIALMGAKTAAKSAAVAAGVPVVPGYHGDDQDKQRLAQEAEKVGIPLMIKASAGGGGRGMRLVDDLGDFPDALKAARAEAKAAFGSGEVLLERYIADARHIEVQVLADRHGNVRHLFERDCSLQRNRQKVIEEAPAPNLPAATRTALLESAVKLARSIGYDNAGTVEYLLDPDTGTFHFLEMNTRLQVEHPVTEAITGIDIVEWQLRIAMNEALPFSQSDISCTGWAVEARLAAEDPAHAYRPETGVITDYHTPETDGLRVDSGVQQGSEISHYYDSMLVKVIGTGPDRATTIARTRIGLEDMVIGGIGTNKGFLIDLLQTRAFAEGCHTTGTIPAVFPQGWQVPHAGFTQLAEAVLVAHLARDAKSASSWHSLGAWRITENAGRPGAAVYHVMGAQLRISGRNGNYQIHHSDHPPFQVTNARWQDHALRYEQDGLRRHVTAALNGAIVALNGAPEIAVLDPIAAEALRNAPPDSGGNTLLAPMPCLISGVLAKTGDKVAQGDAILTIEAMKLLQTLTAPCPGTISEILCQSGDTVASGALLCTINPEE